MMNNGVDAARLCASDSSTQVTLPQDSVFDLGAAARNGDADAAKWHQPSSRFLWCLSTAQLAVLIAFQFTEQPSSAVQPFSAQLYNFYIGVALMMFVGFGYLMTFLRWYGLGAVGLTMLVTALGVEVAVLVEPMFVNGGLSHPLVIDMMAMLNGNFAVATFLISFGGIIGVVSPCQLTIMVVLESIFYSMNKQLILMPPHAALPIVDCGGTIIIHMFGAYFGLAVAAVLGNPNRKQLDPREKNSMSSDITSLLGTVIQWVFWPSFVASPLQGQGDQRSENMALTNTIIALCASTVVTFIFSALFSGDRRLRPVDIQNATLAGGVAIGATANLAIRPGIAMLIGTIAGIVSSLGYAKLQPYLLEKWGLHDSCGIHNLHGMPSIIGATFSIFGEYITKEIGYGATPGKPLLQLGGMVATLAVAIVSGALTGYLMKQAKEPIAVTGKRVADDRIYWQVADNFDKEDKDMD
jgi:ammonium transporter Rh